MSRAAPKSRRPRATPRNGPTADVLTLGEAAAYLRLSEGDVVRLVEEQGLPARRLRNEWCFWEKAIQAWLSSPPLTGQEPGIWAAAGTLKEDPYLEDMLQEIEQMRGRAATEAR